MHHGAVRPITNDVTMYVWVHTIEKAMHPSHKIVPLATRGGGSEGRVTMMGIVVGKEIVVQSLMTMLSVYPRLARMLPEATADSTRAPQSLS